MPTPSAPAWTRLGELLVRRRIELDARYANRQVFAAERGINYRTISDIERGRRDNYEPGTITALEVAYALAPGSVDRALAGGALEPLASAHPVPGAGPSARDPEPGPDDDPEGVWMLWDRPDERWKRDVGRLDYLSWDERIASIKAVVAVQRRKAEETARRPEAGLPDPESLTSGAG